jgi:hypothetical protein
MFHELMSRDREDGCATGQPQGGWFRGAPERTSQGATAEDSRKDGQIRGRSTQFMKYPGWAESRRALLNTGQGNHITWRRGLKGTKIQSSRPCYLLCLQGPQAILRPLPAEPAILPVMMPANPSSCFPRCDGLKQKIVNVLLSHLSLHLAIGCLICALFRGITGTSLTQSNYMLPTCLSV